MVLCTRQILRHAAWLEKGPGKMLAVLSASQRNMLYDVVWFQFGFASFTSRFLFLSLAPASPSRCMALLRTMALLHVAGTSCTAYAACGKQQGIRDATILPFLVWIGHRLVLQARLFPKMKTVSYQACPSVMTSHCHFLFLVWRAIDC